MGASVCPLVGLWSGVHSANMGICGPNSKTTVAAGGAHSSIPGTSGTCLARRLCSLRFLPIYKQYSVLHFVRFSLLSSPPTRLLKNVHVLVGSFLLHRPFVRLDELPLFDTLFTGVQQGEGGRDGGRGRVGDSLGATSASDPGAATTKARVWMLRALRDGERELCVRKKGPI